jgi:hypothetical protein
MFLNLNSYVNKRNLIYIERRYRYNYKAKLILVEAISRRIRITIRDNKEKETFFKK